MAHSLLARDRAAGTVTVLSPASFDRSEDATDAARDLVVSGAVNPEATEILVVDLASASRVEFITLSAPADEHVAEDVDLSPAAGVWETPAEVLPAIGTVDEPESAITPEPVEQREPQPSPELEPEPEPEPEISPEPVVPPEPEPEIVPEQEPEPIVAEPAAEPMPEPAPLPWPAPAAPEPAIAETPSVPGIAPEPFKLLAISEVAIVETLPVVELDVGPYEVSGELVLDRYTCADCVYANTCPKVGESAPAECGSFQWKAL